MENNDCMYTTVSHAYNLNSSATIFIISIDEMIYNQWFLHPLGVFTPRQKHPDTLMDTPNTDTPLVCCTFYIYDEQ